MNLKKGIVGFLVLGVLACTNPMEENQPLVEETIQNKNSKNETEELFQAMLVQHGGSQYDSVQYSFIFRKARYSFKNSGSSYVYTREFVKDTKTVRDEMDGLSFTRKVDGVEQQIPEKEITKYRSSINSVIYFATLPHKLTDASVHKKMIGLDTINGQGYTMMKVAFSEDGGGEDFDDEYLYWIHSENKTMDFFAYNYTVNSGGVRFRAAYNRRNINGIIFQDYINYEAPVGTDLIDLAGMFEGKQLKELSRIETEEVKALP